MKRALIKWWYRRRLRQAQKTLRSLYERHKDAGHEVYFKVLSESDIHLNCVNCPEAQPLRRKPENVEHITVGSDGRPYRG